ncbi:MAG TPA: dihydrofolate reductase family protein, partial [Rhodoglobus sp.]|nr:dihydrofolate reductase family protein [Rhodoglobus sp.]HQA23708.1 dihydrofolate reductase family protein [Rhodoglobus sp.]
MILTRVHPGPPESLELDAASTRDRLLDLYRPAPSPTLRLNLVASISGSAAGSDGTSDTLTSRVDRRILGVIRELSDVVLVGAASVRAEGYQVPQRARLAVLTASGDLAGHRIRPDQRESVIVLAPAEARERVLESLPGAELIIVPTTGPTVAMNDVVDALHSAGFDSIVCEGGPGLAGQLIAAGLVDELCLTTSPQLGGVTLPLLA